MRARQAAKESLLKGESEASVRAEWFRREHMDAGSCYQEAAFRYRGETATVWCKRTYLEGEEHQGDIARKVKVSARGGKRAKGGGEEKEAGAAERKERTARVRSERTKRKFEQLLGQ